MVRTHFWKSSARKCLLLTLFFQIVLPLSAWATKNTHGTPDTQREMQEWWGDMGVPGIVSGCAPAVPSSSLTLAAFACKGYVRSTDQGLIYVEQDAVSAVGPLNSGNGSYWLALHRDSTTTVGGWTRQQGTAYLWQFSASQPAEPSQALIFSKVTVAGGVITASDALRPGSGWVEQRVVGVRTDNPKTPSVFFVNTATPVGPAAATWHQIDVTTLGIPKDAKSVDVGGILIITHGSTVEICNLTVALRAAGDTLDPLNYVFQTIEADVTGGQRDSAYATVPVSNGIFEIQWLRTPTTGSYPTTCAFGINLAAQRYTR